MERLTDKAWRNFDPWECCGQDNYCNESCLNDDDEAVLYWRAYLDGARAQKKEYIDGMDKCEG